MTKVSRQTKLSSQGKIITIGVGTCSISLDRNGPCTLVDWAGTKIVVDLGLGALQGMLKSGIQHGNIDALLATHLHPDHVCEIIPFLFAANYDEPVRTKPLTMGGGKGFSKYVGALANAHGPWLTPKTYKLDILELPSNWTGSIGPITIKTCPANHIESSLAYRFSRNEKSIVITGDGGPSPLIEAFAEKADILLTEAGAPADKTAKGHMTARQAGEAAARAKAKKLILHHVHPSIDAEQAVSDVRKAFSGPVEFGQDGMEIDF